MKEVLRSSGKFVKVITYIVTYVTCKKYMVKRLQILLDFQPEEFMI